ncbi:MAG: MarR family transcriptional regulator [Candidatus Azobacteroides sp.]|nr:MarR family transcriptional regulator [Candidatus Azobacteroides sp.]
MSQKLNQIELFGILNGKISKLINRYLFNRFKEANLGITVEQWTVLACLWQKDKVTQQTLSDITFRDKPSMTRLIDNLEKQNLAVRVPDSTDRRVNLIYLTQKGMDLEKQATQIVQDVVERTLSKMSGDEIMICRNVLKKIFENLT